MSRTTVAVVGLGLMGGSLARALARLPDPPRVLGTSPDADDRAAAERAGVEVRADAAAAIPDADLVVYAAPLAPILAMIPTHASLLRPGAVVTDVAGLKRPVLECARAAGVADRFVGAHPMAGGEGSGFAGGRPDLFVGARVWLCADPETGAVARQRVERLWSDVGGCPRWSTAEAHDRLMERVSQLPQMVANALALALDEAGVSAADLGPGGRDMTRLAGSSPAMWRDLLGHTGPGLAGLLRDMGRWSEALASHLDRGDVDAVAELMARTRAWRAAGKGETQA